MKRAFELGIQLPKTFEGWADFFPRYTTLPWLKGKKHRRVQIMREYMRIAFNQSADRPRNKASLNRLIHNAISVSARWRLDHDVFRAPFELWLKNAANRWFPPLKAKVDAHQLQPRGCLVLQTALPQSRVVPSAL